MRATAPEAAGAIREAGGVSVIAHPGSVTRDDDLPVELLEELDLEQRLEALIGWTGDNGDPDNWLAVLYGCDAIGGNNYSRLCNKEFDALIKKAKAINDQEERTVLYKQAQHLLKADVQNTPIAHSTVYQPMRKEVQDFRISPFGLNSFYGVSIGN